MQYPSPSQFYANLLPTSYGTSAPNQASFLRALRKPSIYLSWLLKGLLEPPHESVGYRECSGRWTFSISQTVTTDSRQGDLKESDKHCWRSTALCGVP